jgi:hypothetical protein
MAEPTLMEGEGPVAEQELPLTHLVSVRKNVTGSQPYAGLKTMPEGSYDRVEIFNQDRNQTTTHFVCNFRGCKKQFAKSTSLIVHYWRHNDVRPFRCDLCKRSFTQSGTLSRHNRAVHKVKSTVSLTQEQIDIALRASSKSSQICPDEVGESAN